MKCARCGHDSKYPERKSRVCPGCKKQFAFEPRENDPLPDMAWKSAIEQVSSKGTVRFTREHLFQAIARRMRPADHSLIGWGIGGVATVVFGVGAAAGSVGLSIAAGVALLIGVALVRSKHAAPPLDMAKFDALYRRWVESHGTPAKLIEPRASPQLPSPEVAEELEGYSFDRAVICDRPETVDLLLGNNFHFENNCAVLTADGYPSHAFKTVRTMLRKNPRLEVFALHDATPEGCKIAHRIKTDPAWFGGSSVRVYDVALRPAQAAKQPTLVWSVSREVIADPALTETERDWLSRNCMYLASLTPEQTIKRLFRAINRMPELASGGDSGDTTVVLWTTDAHASDGGGDSFG